MPERACEVCGLSDADPTAEIWSWTDRLGKFRCRCRAHLTRARWQTVKSILPPR